MKSMTDAQRVKEWVDANARVTKLGSSDYGKNAFDAVVTIAGIPIVVYGNDEEFARMNLANAILTSKKRMKEFNKISG